MRKVGIALVSALGLSLLVAGLASGGGSRKIAAACSSDVIHSGQLTVGTDNPAYPPWFGGNPTKGSKWKVSDPYSGKGFESAVAYAVAKQLGYSKSQVKWVYTPFNKLIAPGPKQFDFDINETSYKPERAKVVDFSDSYYDVSQALVVRKGTPIANVHTIAGLKKFKLGAELGTTSYDTIVNQVKPDSKAVYTSNDKAVFALKAKLIDGLVVDLPTAFYVTAVQVPNSTILGVFPVGSKHEHFGMVFQKGNALRACVNTALATLKKNGTLAGIQRTWLSKVVGVPVLK